MMMIKPVGITPANLYSSVPETDAPAWVAGTYKKGDRVIQNHHVFESLVDTNNVEPAKDSATAPKWLDTGATNRWRMFDKIRRPGDHPGERPGAAAGNAAGHPHVEPHEHRGRHHAGFGGERPGAVRPIRLPGDHHDDRSRGRGGLRAEGGQPVDPAAGDMWEWLFTSVERVDAFALTDLPAYGTARIHILVEAGAGGTAGCSMAVAGQVVTLGTALMGAQFSITDFSTKEKDTFGNDYVTERGYRSTTSRTRFPSLTARSPASGRLLTQYLTRPAVFIGDLKREWTLIYGRFGDLNVVCPNGKYSECTLEVGALI